MVHRVLADQKQGRRLGRTIGSEAGPRIHRLLGGVEQQAAAVALRPHDPDGVPGDGLVGEEVQFEAFAEGLFVHRPDLSLPGGAGVGDHDIHTAVRLAGGIERAAHRGGPGDIARDPPPAKGPGGRFDLGTVHVGQHHLGAGRAKRLSDGGPDGPGGAGHENDFSLKSRRASAAQLGALQRPVFDVEDVPLGQRLEASDPFRGGNGRRIGLRDVGRDGGGGRVLAHAEQSQPGHEDHPGQ